MATIQAVAKPANASAKTVSRVLNGDAPVGRKSRAALRPRWRNWTMLGVRFPVQRFEGRGVLGHGFPGGLSSRGMCGALVHQARHVVPFGLTDAAQIGRSMALHHHPAHAFVAGSSGSPSMTFLEVDVTAVNGDPITVQSAPLKPFEIRAKTGSQAVGGTANLGICPQHPSPAEGAGQLRSKVAVTEPLAAKTMIEVTLSNGTAPIAVLTRDAIFPSAPKSA